ncbi:MAG: hypothetical protein KH751_08375 [Actinomyces sp.]|nr:hypothetical protein [Actinomyces sp.]
MSEKSMDAKLAVIKLLCASSEAIEKLSQFHEYAAIDALFIKQRIEKLLNTYWCDSDD